MSWQRPNSSFDSRENESSGPPEFRFKVTCFSIIEEPNPILVTAVIFSIVWSDSPITVSNLFCISIIVNKLESSRGAG